MRPADARRWQDEVLDEIFAALAASKALRAMFIFRGARVLALRLGGGRQSMDIDCSLTRDVIQKSPSLEEL